MDYSAANTGLWNAIIQMGMIAAAILVGNVMRRKIPFVRRSMMPTAVLGGFILLILKSLNWVKLDGEMLEMITYHGIAIGFIAMSLKVPNKDKADKNLTGLKTGCLIVCSYLVQAIAGLTITLFLSYTFMKELFPAAGILLPMGFGQGPGQANNVGSSYEALGFEGGRSFGLAVAAAGFLCACVVGVFYINYLVRKGKVRAPQAEGLFDGSSIDTFQDENEIPISESLDKLSMQAALIVIVYLLTFYVAKGLTAGISAISPGLGNTLNPLIWGFNFIIGSALAILTRVIFKALRKGKFMTRQYQNNYLLSRISGLAFDVMIVAGIAGIEISDLSGLWVPFILLVIAGAVVTLILLQKVSKKLYPDYYYEGMVSMYGMMTGTISSGVLLLRELDPQFETSAANNLVLGSSFAIIFAAPMLVLISMAPNIPWIVMIILFAYLAALLAVIYKINPKKK